MSDLKVPNYILKEANKWLQKPYDKETQQEIHKLLQSNPKQIIDAFFRNIAFGTGGLRGLMGVGTNRINIYTIQKTTQGLANYILEKKINNPKVFISFDSRVNSKVFAQEAAKVLAGNNINVLITDSLRPTPLVSFGCRHYHCCAAIMITASHNPAEYNGYKVYWSDGGQVVPPHDKEIINHVNQVQDISTVKIAEPTHPLIEFASQKTDNAYLGTINQLQNFPEVNKKNGDKLSIIYSSLHGCGIELIPQALSEWGFTNLSVVLKQANPDGSFPTINTPNPEQSEALELGINQLEKEQKDIFIASDPDADRLGVVALHKNIHYTFTGNQIAAICLYYLCSVKKLSKNHACITTIVTTELLKEIARSFDIQYVEVLTGFKYIGEIITEWESSKDHKFLFGAEESLGYLYGDHARDKDAVVSSCLIAEIALYLKLKDMTLVDYLEEIYAKKYIKSLRKFM